MHREGSQLCLFGGEEAGGVGLGLPRTETKPLVKVISHCAEFDDCQVDA